MALLLLGDVSSCYTTVDRIHFLFFCLGVNFLVFYGSRHFIIDITIGKDGSIDDGLSQPPRAIHYTTNSSRSELSGLAEKATPAVTESTIPMTSTANELLL